MYHETLKSIRDIYYTETIGEQSAPETPIDQAVDIVVKKSVLSESYTFTEKPFIHDTQAEAIKEAQRLLQKTLVMGETNCEFQVLKIDKIVRPVVISPIEIV